MTTSDLCVEAASSLLLLLRSSCRLARGRLRCRLVEPGAEDEEQRLLTRERHAVLLQRMTPDLRDELLLVRGAGLEPAITTDDAFHDSSRRH